MSSVETIVVTGGMGKVGRWVLDRLESPDREIHCIDVDRPADAAKYPISFWEADLTDAGEARDLIHAIDPDIVVHLAAIPSVVITSGTRTFETNVMAGYNVFVAAGEVGAKVVWTSSNATYGTVFADPPWIPDYLPIDEEHPFRPEDPYGTSKVVGEEIAKMVMRKYSVPVLSVRAPLIQHPGEYVTSSIRKSFDPNSAEPDGGYWSYIDGRDVAAIIERGISVEFDGHEAVLAAASENYLDRPTLDVIETVYGSVPDQVEISGDESAYSTAKARDLLGWEPEINWRDAENETESIPTF